ncbi:hypothetical protein N7520_002173 [Penicillium odoratum]|uniref:uncharacterized protein n=1 Tax=Penicillium odoratum TaxID=1167516 RepID=UPI0025483E15|nr:uncharacterized protein N7520_002173 [Penicillium odoratum]KAJ5771644.1 hypothetical protein N7520_002173 [Penicillium odoratum]
MESENICSACSWTPARQKACHYNSHIKIFYGVSTRAWSLGSKLILKERPAAPPNFESINIAFLAERTSIPIPEIMEAWEEEDMSFKMSRRIPGQNLDEAWPILSEEDRERIAKQMADYLIQLRGLQSTRMESLDEKPLYHAFLFGSYYGTPHEPMSSDEEFWNQMALALSHVPEEIRLRLRERMPTAATYTFSHTDLTSVNIMVENGNLSGIIDWEGAGIYPVWWEFACAGIGLGEEDKQWKDTLRKYMPKFEEGHNFWLDLCSLRRYPDLNERGLAFLKDCGFALPKA